MSRESLGYIKLEWTCPKCGGRNPGPEKTCQGCGAPQPENVKFEQVSGAELITDEAEIARAKAGPDIHCGFCGTRNPGNASKCLQCGADLAAGTQRQAGQVIGAYQSTPVREVACPNCGQMNAETVMKCAHCGASTKAAPMPAASPAISRPAASEKKSNLGMIALFAVLGLVAVCVIIFIALSLRTQGHSGIVQSVTWATVVEIESLRPATYQAWWDEIPSQATPGSCRQEVRTIQDNPAPNANKVCGTPYTVDTGSGHAEVVQDCKYEVLEDYCDYTVMEWKVVDEARMQGIDYSPVFAEPQLAADQRQGGQSQTFTVLFQTDDGQKSYTTSNLDEFRRYQIGSEWVLNINTFGAILSVDPK